MTEVKYLSAFRRFAKLTCTSYLARVKVTAPSNVVRLGTMVVFAVLVK